MMSLKAVAEGCCSWNRHCVEGWRAQDHCVVRAEWMLQWEWAFETVAVRQKRACRCQSNGAHWLVSMKNNFAPEAVVHILEIQVVEARQVGRIDMEGKVVDRSVVRAGG